MKLKDYVRARIDLYVRHMISRCGTKRELFAPDQQDKILDLKNKVWDATVAACRPASFRTVRGQALPALTSASKSHDCASAPAKNIHRRSSMRRRWVLAGRSAAGWLRHGGGHSTQRTYMVVCGTLTAALTLLLTWSIDGWV